MGDDDLLLVAIIGATVLTALGPWVWLVASQGSRRTTCKRMETELRKAGLRLDDDVRLTIRLWATQRARAQAIGSGVGLTIGCAMAFALIDILDLGAGVLFLLGAFVGMNGSAAGGSPGAPMTAPSGPRVTAMQPHGLSDYLRGREITLEVACVGAGTVILLGGASLAAIGRISSSAGAVALILGSVVATVSVGGLLFPRRMLRAPMPADSRARVVANDIVLATGIRDLFGMIVAAASFSLLSWLYWLDGPAWQHVAGTAAILAFMLGSGDRCLRPDIAPVAHRLAGRAAA